MALRNAALLSNRHDRLGFSCAVFNATGKLSAQTPTSLSISRPTWAAWPMRWPTWWRGCPGPTGTDG